MIRKKQHTGNGEKEMEAILGITAAILLAIIVLSGLRPCQVRAASGLSAPGGLMVSGVKDTMVLSWEPVKGADGYEIMEKQEGQKGWSVVAFARKEKRNLSGRQAGVRYIYRVRAYEEKKSGRRYGAFSRKCDAALPETAVSTIRNFLKVSLAPVGSTMYIWGGGWNKADDAAGKDALRIGLNPQWRSFAGRQSSSYNYRNYRYKRGFGLDCSGFVGWSVYNAFHTRKGKQGEGYVDKARNLAGNYAKNGWGSYRSASRVTEYRAGDIMSGSGHVYIVIGECPDGSVVLVHSSPAGVQICGTATPSGKKDSRAVKLARKYMKKYYPSWYRRYPNCFRDVSYLKYDQFRWDVRGGNVMEDPDHYRDIPAAKILKDLFAGR